MKVVGDALEDQKVILLMGNQSSGKTTTLHCLAGTSFKEVVVEEEVKEEAAPTAPKDPKDIPFEVVDKRDEDQQTLF